MRFQGLKRRHRWPPRKRRGDRRAPFTNPVEKNVPTFEAFEHEPGVWRDAASCDAPHRAPMKAIAAARPVTCPKHGAQQCPMYNCGGTSVQLWELSEYPGSVFDSALNAFSDLKRCQHRPHPPFRHSWCPLSLLWKSVLCWLHCVSRLWNSD